MREANLNDLKLELWLRERNRGSILWRTKYGTLVPIKDMEYQHLINTIKMIERNLREDNSYNLSYDEAFGSIDLLDYYD